MQTHDSYHQTYQQIQYIPVIKDLRLMAEFLQQNYKKYGLMQEAKHLRALEFQLDYLRGYKSAAFDFVSAVASGQTLLVGEGNLSFALSLANQPKVLPRQMTATTYEPRDDLSDLTQKNAAALSRMGAQVIHGVDATKLKTAFPTQRSQPSFFSFPIPEPATRFAAGQQTLFW